MINKIIKFQKIIMITVIILIIFTSPAYVINWQQFKENNISKMNSENELEEEVMIKYNIAISDANLGEIIEFQNRIEEMEKYIGKKKFENTVYPHIKDVNYESNNILELNQTAFYYLLMEKYKKSATYFNKILELKPNNIWTMNYLAGCYIMLNKNNKAEKLLKKVDNIQSNEFTNLLYSYIYYQKGYYIKAFSRFSKSGNLVNENLFK